MALTLCVFQRVNYWPCKAVWMRSSAALQWSRNFSGYLAHCYEQDNKRHLGEQAGRLVKPEDENEKSFVQQDRKLSDLKDEQTTSVTFETPAAVDDVRKPRNRGTRKSEYRKWSKAEVDLLLQLRAEGKTSLEQSKALDRSPLAIRVKAAACRITTSYTPYTATEDAMILAAGAASSAWKDVQRHMPHRNIGAMRSRYERLIGRIGDTVSPGNAPRTPFTHAEDECIKKLRNQGMRWAKIAQAIPGGIRRDPNTVRERYMRIVPKSEWVSVLGNHHWSAEDCVRLRNMLEGGRSRRDIAAELGRSCSAVGNKILSMSVTPSSSQSRFWTQQELDKLVELDARREFSVAEMARMMNRKFSSITYKLHELGLKRKGGRKYSRGGRRNNPRVDGAAMSQHKESS